MGFDPQDVLRMMELDLDVSTLFVSARLTLEVAA